MELQRPPPPCPASWWTRPFVGLDQLSGEERLQVLGLTAFMVLGVPILLFHAIAYFAHGHTFLGARDTTGATIFIALVALTARVRRRRPLLIANIAFVTAFLYLQALTSPDEPVSILYLYVIPYGIATTLPIRDALIGIVTSTVAFVTMLASSQALPTLMSSDKAELIVVYLLLSVMAAFGVGLRRRYQSRLEQQNAEVFRLASTDPLTGCLNRTQLLSTLRDELARARRRHTPLSLILGDIDHFKAINDTWGHPAGDAVLRQLGALLRRETRDGVDKVFRIGGEEFLLVLSGTRPEDAQVLADRIRRALREHPTPWQGGDIQHTMSFGVTALSDEDAHEESLLGRVDTLLYAAKDGGRDRVIAA